jgi:AraC-like DNA-binding protein
MAIAGKRDMHGKLLSTNDVCQHQRFAYWQDLICDAIVNLDCSAPERANFKGSIHVHDLGNLRLSTMVSDQMSLFRSTQRISRVREDCLLVAIESHAQSFGAQDGREAQLEMGDFALFDSVRPYDVGFRPGFQHLVIRIPRRALQNRVGPLHNLTGMRIRGDRGAGRLASQFFRTLRTELEYLDQATASRLGETGLDLIAAALADMSGDVRLDESAHRGAWIARIKNFINTHLADPMMSPGMIASALGISTRYLSALFSSEAMSIERYIWERRLVKCHDALGNPAQKGCSISSIAFGWGFNDMSHFSRVFRNRFGVSPREYRLTQS